MTKITGGSLRAMLESLQLTQKDFATVVGVHPRHVRSWCNNEHPIPLYADVIASAMVDGKIDLPWLGSLIASAYAD